MMSRYREELIEARVETAVQQERLRLRTEAAEEELRQNQIKSVQSRLLALQTAKLLSTKELQALEDAIEDSLCSLGDDDCAMRIVALSERTASSNSFARQLRRKFL